MINLLEKEKVINYPNTVIGTPLVSVCVATYQHVKYIKACLDGILMQKTDFEYEILLGEDESTDGTRKICIEYAKRYPDKIKLFLHSRKNNIKINGNPTGRFNFLFNLQQAKGKYIALCEGDDYWTDPLKLQKQVDFLGQNPDYAICFHNVKIWEENKQKLVGDYITKQVPATTTIRDLAMGNYIHTPSVMYKNKLFDKFPTYFAESPVGDYFLHMLNARYGKIKKIKDNMAVYRVHDTSMWSSLSQKTRSKLWIEFLEKIKINFDIDIQKIINKQLVVMCISVFY